MVQRSKDKTGLTQKQVSVVTKGRCQTDLGRKDELGVGGRRTEKYENEKRFQQFR